MMQVVNLGRSAREAAQIRTRQPLSTIYVRAGTETERESLRRLGDQALEELNVKRLELLPAESDMLVYSLRPNHRALGPKLGTRMQPALAALKAMNPQQAVHELRETGTLTVTVNGEPVTLTPEDVAVEASAREGFVAAEDRGYVVVLETALTPALVAEGLVRDLTHTVQDVRKRAGLAIEDSITLWLDTDADMTEIVRHHQSYIQAETLATALHLDAKGAAPSDGYSETIPAAKLGGHEVTVTLRKA